ncbi:MAG: LacI family transcriptional regulator [Treponema sp.]|jgi:LacI family transcriptional regulator|nr:LacI family transcriptional regulator [Treponema sp.]
MATIYDIARHTGFSPPTVSKALNDIGSISEETKELIRKAARELDYVPNMSARTLTTRKSHLIGIIDSDLYRLDTFSPPTFTNIMAGFKQVMEKQNFELLLLSRLCPNYRNIDGILIMAAAPDQCDPSLYARYPCISVNDTLSGITKVITANYAGAVAAVQHLIDLGHRRIAYIHGPITSLSQAAMERRRGYQDCLKRNGIPRDDTLIENAGNWQPPEGSEAARRLLNRRPDITAVFACSDHLAYGVLKTLAEKSRKVPRDVSVIGFDGDPFGEFFNPSLTTMSQDATLIGRTAGELLLKKLAGQKCPDAIRISAQLVVRESTRCQPDFTGD